MDLNLLYPKYTELRSANKEFARKMVISLYHHERSISKVAALLRTTRKTVRKTIKRFEAHKEEGLKDLSRRPKRSPNKTPPHLELAIISLRKRTGYGRDRIVRILREKGIEVKLSTVRYVLKRYGIKGKYKRSKYRRRQRFYDFETLYPLSHFEVDLKEIYDRDTLQEACITHASKINIPPYQWTAIDVKTRLRFLSYSYEKSFTNGLIFMLSVIYFLRAFGVKHEIILQTDNGEEFGGKSVDKLDYLNRMVFKPLNAKLIHIPKGKKEYNAFVERSHQTDDNEFYIPQIELCRDLKEFLFRAMRWQWVYNTIRFHSSISATPYEKLLQYGIFPKKIALFPVMILDKTVNILDVFFPKRGGYYVLAKDRLENSENMGDKSLYNFS